MQSQSGQPLVLLTGATGYVGGRLLRALQSDGVRVRCLVRDRKRLHARLDLSTEVVEGDVMNPADLIAAMEGVTHAYYLVHSMAATADFVRRDREAATNFAAAANAAGVARIIYLGGLGSGDNLSPHLAAARKSVASCGSPEYQPSSSARRSSWGPAAFPSTWSARLWIVCR